MKTKGFLVVNSRGGIKSCKTKPKLGADEVAIALNIDLPNSIFERPSLSGTIVLKEEDAPEVDITPEMKTEIEKAVSKSFGLDVTLTIAGI